MPEDYSTEYLGQRRAANWGYDVDPQNQKMLMERAGAARASDAAKQGLMRATEPRR